MADCNEYPGKYLPGMKDVIRFAEESKMVQKCTIEEPKTRSGKHTEWKIGWKLEEGTYLSMRLKDGVLIASVNSKNQFQVARLHCSDPSGLKELFAKEF